VDEFGNNAVKVAIVDGDDLVQALSPSGPHPALGHRVGARCPEWRLLTVEGQVGGAPAEFRAPSPVTVMDQISRFAVPGGGFDQLPPNPGGGGMGGDLEVDKRAPPMADEEEDVQRLECQGLVNEQVGGPDHLSVVGEKGAPTLAGRRRMAGSPVAPDRASADDNAEL
ncbi:MAG TPA: hypothetical protein VNL71_19915, partial [Chloroflexota bacterium]|nr:hypothetical protein [Chloroflexota bacterium]